MKNQLLNYVKTLVHSNSTVKFEYFRGFGNRSINFSLEDGRMVLASYPFWTRRLFAILFRRGLATAELKIRDAYQRKEDGTRFANYRSFSYDYAWRDLRFSNGIERLDQSGWPILELPAVFQANDVDESSTIGNMQDQMEHSFKDKDLNKFVQEVAKLIKA